MTFRCTMNSLFAGSVVAWPAVSGTVALSVLLPCWFIYDSTAGPSSTGQINVSNSIPRNAFSIVRSAKRVYSVMAFCPIAFVVAGFIAIFIWTVTWYRALLKAAEARVHATERDLATLQHMQREIQTTLTTRLDDQSRADIAEQNLAAVQRELQTALAARLRYEKRADAAKRDLASLQRELQTMQSVGLREAAGYREQVQSLASQLRDARLSGEQLSERCRGLDHRVSELEEEREMTLNSTIVAEEAFELREQELQEEVASALSKAGDFESQLCELIEGRVAYSSDGTLTSAASCPERCTCSSSNSSSNAEDSQCFGLNGCTTLCLAQQMGKGGAQSVSGSEATCERLQIEIDVLRQATTDVLGCQDCALTARWELVAAQERVGSLLLGYVQEVHGQLGEAASAVSHAQLVKGAVEVEKPPVEAGQMIEL